MSIRSLLLDISIPASKAIAHVAKPECLVTSAQFSDLKSKIRDGDVLLSQVDWELSNHFIPGTYKHCGVYNSGLVYESTTHLTRKILLEEFFFKKDKVALVRFKRPMTDDKLIRGLGFLESNLGEPYDYGFSIEGSRAWYCSKYVRAFFIAADPSFEQSFELRKVLGEPTVKPDDYWLDTELFDQIAKYN